MNRNTLEKPSVVEDNTDRTFPLDIFLAVTTCEIERKVLLDRNIFLAGRTDGPCKTIPSDVGRKEKPPRGLVVLL